MKGSERKDGSIVSSNSSIGGRIRARTCLGCGMYLPSIQKHLNGKEFKFVVLGKKRPILQKLLKRYGSMRKLALLLNCYPCGKLVEGAQRFGAGANVVGMVVELAKNGNAE